MSARGRKGGAARWFTEAPYRFRLVDADGDTGTARYADTLADIRADLDADGDAVRAIVERRTRLGFVLARPIVKAANR